MAEIPPFVFIVLGIVIAGFSSYINISQRTLAMTVFILAGAAMIAWGVIKIIMQKQKTIKQKTI